MTFKVYKIKKILWLFLLLFNSFSFSNDYIFNNIPNALMIDLGKEVYFSKSTDSCAKCHGDITKKNLEGKEIEQSADLQNPYTWVAFKALGGENKKSKNPESFNQQFDNVIIELIINGAYDWNREFYKKATKDFDFNWNRVEGKEQYDSQMKGIKISIVKNILKKMDRILRKEGVKVNRKELESLAAVSVYKFVKNHFK